jgi:hypothetical protein
MFKIRGTEEEARIHTHRLFLVEDPDHPGVTVKAEDDDGETWYLATFNDEGVLLHEGLPDDQGFTLNKKCALKVSYK